ncbi:MAG: hypothetical protein GYB54_15890 [Gammaproteobacteria bacterium]|nr:hypothetical protein [Gammaproteobacteria bacterium]
MATQQTHLIDLLIDLELDRRLDHEHTRPGWAPISSLELVGMPVGKGRGGSLNRETLVNRLNELRDQDLHLSAKSLLDQIPVRRRIAMLIQAAESDSRLEGPWCVSYDEIISTLPHYLQMLGFAPRLASSLRFGSVQALKDAAKNGKKQLDAVIPKTRGEGWPLQRREAVA